MKPSIAVLLSALSIAACQLRTESGTQDDSDTSSGSAASSAGGSSAGSATGTGSSGGSSSGGTSSDAVASAGSSGASSGTSGVTSGATSTTGGTTTGTQGCFPACGAGAACVNGSCQCLAGFTPCGTDCADTNSDVTHCGTCDNDCTIIGSGISDLGCNAGHCDCGSTGQGTICPGPICTNEKSDPQNCGGCGNLCTFPATDCINANCACPDSQTLCGGACIDTDQSPSDCGVCGNDCATSYATNAGCRFGICSCSPGQTVLCGDAGSGNAACVPTGTCGE